jgi:oligopeptide/dipeptide ABC transporter ATP-binding protein
MKKPLVEIKGLRTYFNTEEGLIKAVEDLDLTIMENEILGLVGESGCGKTVTAKSVLRLIPMPPGEVVGGEILFEGKDLLRLPKHILRKEIRGNRISMIFQDPMTSLNPVITVGNQIAESFRLHRKSGKKLAIQQSVEMLRRVGIPAPEKMVFEYPHRYSGGMRQRAMIAMAMACNPSLLIADEPSTALDVTIQAQIIELIKSIKEEFKTSILLITHNLGVVAEMAERVAVMYAGQLVELCEVNTFFDNPKHPYSIGLLNSFPGNASNTNKLNPIPGSIPDMLKLPSGCKFHPRCDRKQPCCTEELPNVIHLGNDHLVRCWLYENVSK